MSIFKPNMSANTSAKKPAKEGELLPTHPDFTKNFKLMNDPALTRCSHLVYRHDGKLPGMKSPVEVADPRPRFPRSNTRGRNVFLVMPDFIVDKYYVLPIKPKEVSFSNLNNNVNVKFLEDMCKGFGNIQDANIYYHPVTKKHLGLGRVLFSTSSAAQKCAEKLHNSSSMGNILNVFLDDKGVERNKMFKELTKDPCKAEFIPPMPSSHLQKDVLVGMFPASSTSTGLPLPGVALNTFMSPGVDKNSSNHLQTFSSNQAYLRTSSTISSDLSVNGESNLLQRKGSTSTAGCAIIQRSTSGEGLFGNAISGNPSHEFAKKMNRRLTHDAGSTNVVIQNSTGSACQPALNSPPPSSLQPFHHRQAQIHNHPMTYNSRDCRPFSDAVLKEKPEPHVRGDKYFDYGPKEKNSNRRDDRRSDKKWSWNRGKEHKERPNKNCDKSNWKDKFSSPNNWKDRNREKRDFYDKPYNLKCWNKQNKEEEMSPRRAPENSHSIDDVGDVSRIGTPGLSSSERGKSKSTDTPDKNGQTPFSDQDEKKSEIPANNNFMDKRVNLLANSDDNAIDSSHLFVQHPKKMELNDQEDDKHESLESRIQALLGQNLSFALPTLAVPAPVAMGSISQKTPPPQPPLPPSPPLPPPPSQNDLEANVPPPLPSSIYSYPPPPITVPLPMTPVVPPSISYPPMPQNVPIFPIVGAVPPLVNQHLEPGHQAMMVQWGYPMEAIATPTPGMNLPPLNIPPPPLPQGGVPKVFLEDPEVKRLEETRAKFRKVFNELIYQLKEVLSKDLKKKMVEVAAFKEFEDWWNAKNMEHNEKLLSSRQQQLKPLGTSSSADLRSGEQKTSATANGTKPSSDMPSSDRTQMMDTLSGLFDKSGSFAGGLLGLRNMRLTSMPSFRKKQEPPKVENERIKNIQDDDDDDDDEDDDDIRNRRPTFKGPRTPEGSENEGNVSSYSSECESDMEPPPPPLGKSYKPPSPPPSPIHVRKEPDKKMKTKKEEKKISRAEHKTPRMDIYSSSSSPDSIFSRKDVEDGYDDDDDDDLSDGSSDIDVMNLVKKVKEPARKINVYTSDEDEDDDQKNETTTLKRKAPSACSSPSASDSDSDAEKNLPTGAAERSMNKKPTGIRTSTPKQKSSVPRMSAKSQKEEASKRKSAGKKTKSVSAKRQRIRSRSTKDDDNNDASYISRVKKDDVRAVNAFKDTSQALDRLQTAGERKRCSSLASSDVRFDEMRNYEEIRPVDGYLHLLSDVASEVKQAEVDNLSKTAFYSSKVIGEQSSGHEEAAYKSPKYPPAYEGEEVLRAPRLRTCSLGDVSLSSMQEVKMKSVRELGDHGYSLKPWMEVKSKKGRKPKHKSGVPPSTVAEFEASSGDETVVIAMSDNEEALKSVDDDAMHLLRQVLREHCYATTQTRYQDISYKSSDSEVEEVPSEWQQAYVEDLDSDRSGKGERKFTLEAIPHVGREVEISHKKPELEKNINVVDDDDEEEEGEYHSSSEEGRMVIDEGMSSRPTPSRKRKRSHLDSDVTDGGEKKLKVDKKLQRSSKHSNASSKLPRELVNLFQPSFTTQEPKPAKFAKRDFKEEAFVLYDFVTKGVDEEDAHFIKLQYEKMLHREQEKLGQNSTESACKWVLETKWVDHPVKHDSDSQPTKKSRKSSKQGGTEPHKSGSARTEGYYKIPHQAKQYLKHAHGVEEQHSLLATSDEFPANSVSSTSLINSEANFDAMLKKRAHQSRDARSEGRRWQNLLTSNLGEDVADMLKFNQLQLRKKQLRFAKSRIHDWGLFAMEPIAEGELVIEYIGQVIRQTVADLREKRYEAEGIGSSYLFRIDQSTIVDATRFGNLSRFINHCCNPNCYAKIVSVDGVKRIVIYSRRDIEVNEEITYDYKFPIEDEKIPCLCGAAGCRGTLN